MVTSKKTFVRIATLFLALLCLFGCCTVPTVFADPIRDAIQQQKDAEKAMKEDLAQAKNAKPVAENEFVTVYIEDNARVLSKEDEAALIETVFKYTKDLTPSFNVLFLTTSNNWGLTTQIYSDSYMDAMFERGVENNIAFVIDYMDREIYVNTMGTAIQRLSDSSIKSVLKAGYKKIAGNDTEIDSAYQCLNAMAKKGLKKLNVANEAERIFVRNIIISIALGLAVAIYWVKAVVQQHNQGNERTAIENYIQQMKRPPNRNSIYIKTTSYFVPFVRSGGGGGSGGGGSSHSSSSGRSHGGGGMKF